MPSRKGKYNEPYHEGLYRFQDEIHITIGGGLTKSAQSSTRQDGQQPNKSAAKADRDGSPQIFSYGADGK